ncbi:MAG: exo-alpha-sialidase [Ignavibacteriales bacterium]|nr:exo-alpha-sialidase [Ignavibacteriales bacterium]
MPNSNSVGALAVSGDTVWFGTGRGLSYSLDGFLWRHFTNTATFDDKGISAISISEELVWASIGFTERRDDNFIQVGGGLHWSSDRGITWNKVPQPVDEGTIDTLTYGNNRIRALAITVPQQNITFDISQTSGIVWIASFAGMLRKSTNRGASWQRVILPPDNLNSISPDDTLDFDLTPSGGALGLRENLNHRVFSVHASSDSTIWVGTAAGINKSTDAGISWERFSHQNQVLPISGNFVVAINEQTLQTRRILWASTVNAVDPDERQGVSYSENGGLSWTTVLLGERAHNIAFKDSVVYVATDRGVLRSADFGQTWIRSGTIYDQENHQRFTGSAIYAVALKGDTVWIGGPEGTAFTIDSPSQMFGMSWKVFRTYEPIGNTPRTYAYPTPFSPDDESLRIHYGTQGRDSRVTIWIFDFAMQPVKTLLQNAYRTGSIEHDELWNGMDDRGNRVTNGVYFYRIEVAGEETSWGKILVIQ